MVKTVPELIFLAGQGACVASLIYGAWLCLRHLDVRDSDPPPPMAVADQDRNKAD